MKRGLYLVLDLETVTDASLPPPPKKRDGGESFPAPPYHEIVVMGAALLDARGHLRRLWTVSEGRSEPDTLAALASFLHGNEVTVVTWNGRGFDLPVIVARCMKHGIAFPWYYARREPRYRYSPAGHLDLMDFLCDHGAGRCYGLDLAAKLIGLPGKLDCKGADVATMIEAGQLEQVRAYCLQDVAQTTALFLRAQLLRGEVTAAEHDMAMEALLSAIAREPRTAPLLPLVNRERLMLASAPAEPLRRAS
jgi:hypothetical protein